MKFSFPRMLFTLATRSFNGFVTVILQPWPDGVHTPVPLATRRPWAWLYWRLYHSMVAFLFCQMLDVICRRSVETEVNSYALIWEPFFILSLCCVGNRISRIGRWTEWGFRCCCFYLKWTAGLASLWLGAAALSSLESLLSLLHPLSAFSSHRMPGPQRGLPRARNRPRDWAAVSTCRMLSFWQR